MQAHLSLQFINAATKLGLQILLSSNAKKSDIHMYI